MIAFLHPLGIVHVFDDHGNLCGSVRKFAGEDRAPANDAEALAELETREWKPQGEFASNGKVVEVKVVPKR